MGNIYHFDFGKRKLVPVKDEKDGRDERDGKGGGGRDLLQIGQVVSYHDMANPRRNAVIVESPGNEYGQKCVFEDGGSAQLSGNRITNRAGWNLEDRILNAEEIAAWVRTADAATARKELEKEQARIAKEKADAETKARLLKEYPQLELRETSKKSDHALGAANIRRLLRQSFPGVVFKVTSDSYSGGDSIHVHWTDGPTTEMVVKISDDFQECDFDGMDDSTHYRHSIFTEVFGGAKYVQEQRDISEARMRQVADEIGYKGLEIKCGDIVGANHETNCAFRREYYSRDYRDGVAPPLERTEGTRGTEDHIATDEERSNGPRPATAREALMGL